MNSISMPLNALHCFIPQLTILILSIAETDQNTIDGDANVSKTDNVFLPHIFRFLYNNEQLCKLAFAYKIIIIHVHNK